MVPRATWEKLDAAGFLCPWLPEEYGGSGVDFVFSASITEELCRVGAASFFAIDDGRKAELPTVFPPAGNGLVTAGSARPLSDGAGAVLVANREVAETDGFRPRARFRARVAVGSPCCS